MRLQGKTIVELTYDVEFTDKEYKALIEQGGLDVLKENVNDEVLEVLKEHFSHDSDIKSIEADTNVELVE